MPWTPDYDVIPSVPSTLAQVQDAAQNLLAKINAVDFAGLSRSVQAVLDDAHTLLGKAATRSRLWPKRRR